MSLYNWTFVRHLISGKRFSKGVTLWAQLGKQMCFSSQVPKVTTKLFIHGDEVESQSDEWTVLRSPENNKVISHVPKCLDTELDRAMSSASETASVLSRVPVTSRQMMVLGLYEVMRQYRKDFIHSIVSEAGKTVNEAAMEFEITMKVIQHYFSASLSVGDALIDLRNGTDAYSSIESLGVTASITPFNYPLLIPVTAIIPALVAGNTMITKPSEKSPGATLLLAKLVKLVGFPDGSLNVVYGRNATAFLCEHPSVKAIMFIGSTKVGKYVYSKAGENLKRVQCANGAKNHTVIMQDADKRSCFKKIMEAAFAEGGQRCLSTSVVIFVGSAKEWISEFVDEVKTLSKNMASSTNERKITALISNDAKTTIGNIITSAEEEGATALLDGRNIVVKGFENGNFIGPTILSNVQTSMQCYQKEIFGPVLCVFALDSLDEAIKMINSNQYGNCAVIHTTSGLNAKQFSSQVDVGQVGVNVGITMPYPVFPYTGTKQSFYGSLYTYAKDGIYFNSKVKTHLQNWKDESRNLKLNMFMDN